MLGKARRMARHRSPHTQAQVHVGALDLVVYRRVARDDAAHQHISASALGYLVRACTDTSTARLPLPSPIRSNGENARPAPGVVQRRGHTVRAADRTCSHRSGKLQRHRARRLQPDQAGRRGDFGRQIGGVQGVVEHLPHPKLGQHGSPHGLVGSIGVVGHQYLVARFQQGSATLPMAASPLGTSTQCRPPSSAHKRSSSVKVVGVPCSP